MFVKVYDGKQELVQRAETAEMCPPSSLSVMFLRLGLSSNPKLIIDLPRLTGKRG